MIYDSHPTYPHHDHLPYSHEPLKGIYVFQRLLTTLLLVPVWVAYYALAPRSARPRPSWSLRQIVYVNFTRRIYKVTEVAGVTFGTRNPGEEPPHGSLKETTFEWVDPLPENLRTGVVKSEPEVPFKKVGVFVWRREVPARYAQPSERGTSLIGIFMHGGGYCHMSAHENSGPSRIPRRLIKDPEFSAIYAVEYRLLQYAPFPAVIQDAAAVYAHVVQKYINAGDDRSADALKYKIVLIGDSSGGNLALALARWVRDEGMSPAPAGMLLFSPSCDISHSFPDAPSSYIPRPHASTDYLVDTPVPRALLQRTFLGFQRRAPAQQQQGREWARLLGGAYSRVARADEEEGEEERARLMRAVHSEYVSPASPHVLLRHGHVVRVGDAAPALAPAAGRAAADTRPPPGVLVPWSDEAPTRVQMDVPAAGGEGVLPKGRRLFGGFPRTLVTLGTHERLVREVESLVGAMECDGVDVRLVRVEDGVHDVFVIPGGWWDERVKERVWRDVGGWVAALHQ